MPKKKKKFLIVIICILLVLAAAAGAVALYVNHTLGKVKGFFQQIKIPGNKQRY